MKFPVSMLLDFVRTALSPEELGDLLTMAGFELEGIEDDVLDIKVVSNRGDGLSVFGLAREVLAKDAASEATELYTRAASRFADLPADGPTNPASVSIETTDCPRYACRVYEGVANGEAPSWIRERLTQAGMRPISLLVDLTNYVMLELGQPLHAFDYDRLEGGRIVVRKARAGETLTTLDGKAHDLLPNQMMICDAERPVAAAGTMGGEVTEVSADTKRVLLESAAFLNTSVRKTRKQLGLNTEASYRFERSVDPEGVVAAILRFTELLGISGSAIVDAYPGRTVRESVALRPARARLLLGMDVTDHEAETHLRRLGMDVRREGDRLMVVPPSWRPDIVREEDLVEEIGRVHGYEKIPETPVVGTSTLGGPQGELLLEDRLREAIVRLGYVQAISHSLRDLHPLDAPGERLGPRNPGSPEASYLRNSMLPGLAEAAARNGGKGLRFFEIGRAFAPGELRSLGMAITPPDADFFALKGDLVAAAQAVGVRLELTPAAAPDARLHPGRQADLIAGGRRVGTMGELHPEVAAAAGLPVGTTVAEIDLSDLLGNARPEIILRPVGRNPANPRDIALLIDQSVPYAQVEAKVEVAGGDLLEKQSLVEVYTGAGIPEGKHSLTIRLVFRKVGGNLTDEEANRARDGVVVALAELGGARGSREPECDAPHRHHEGGAHRHRPIVVVLEELEPRHWSEGERRAEPPHERENPLPTCLNVAGGRDEGLKEWGVRSRRIGVEKDDVVPRRGSIQGVERGERRKEVLHPQPERGPRRAELLALVARSDVGKKLPSQGEIDRDEAPESEMERPARACAAQAEGERDDQQDRRHHHPLFIAP